MRFPRCRVGYLNSVSESGVPGWFLAVFIPMFILGLVFAVAMFKRDGLAGVARTMTGRGPYKPRESVFIGMAGIAAAAIFGRFWIAAAVVFPVIAYTWWRYWQASGKTDAYEDLRP